MNEQLLTKEELAVRLNISAYDVDQLRKKRRMQSIKIGKSHRYDLEYVKKFISSLSEDVQNEKSR